jgi:hypothetical protein
MAAVQRHLRMLCKDLSDNLIGNQPPWKLPAKGRYGKFDSNRASQYFGKNYKVASFFPLNSLLVCEIPVLKQPLNFADYLFEHY